MKRPPEIQINQFQLAILLDNSQKEFYNYVLADNVFCGHCGGVAGKGIIVDEIYLTSLNDVMVRGICRVCNGKVARCLEFGEDKAFYNRATDFRKSINPSNGKM